MKRLTTLTTMLGLFLVSLLIAYFGADEVVAAVAATGWAALAVVVLRILAIAGDGIAWRLLFPPGLRPRVRVAVLLRGIREGINQLLPVAQVGGEIVGARLLTFWGHEGTLATASVVSDVVVQAATQFAFALVGLALLVLAKGDSDLVQYVGLGLVVAALALLGFVLALRGNGARIFGRVLARFSGGRDPFGAGGLVERLYAQLGTIYANPAGVAASSALHMAIWFFGAAEVWIVLHAIGYPVTIAEAIVIESLGQAVRGAAFAVPGGLGVQEGGFVALCALFGIPPGPALALSLVKRLPDLVIGIPGLLAWQWLEGRRVLRGSGTGEREMSALRGR